MKLHFTLLTLLFFNLLINAQNSDCNCLTDLDFVISEVKNTPSFKSQINDESYLNKYIDSLKLSIKNDSNIELNCLAYLQKYLKIVKDNHLYISDNTDKDYSSFFPIEKNIDTIIEHSTNTESDELVGIYSLLDLYKVAVVKDGDTNYKAILLETSNDKWQIGQTKFKLIKTLDGFEGVFYDGKQKPSYVKIEYKNGRLYPEQWIKEDNKSMYSFNPYTMDDETFEYKKLNEKTHYVRLGSFSGMTTNHNKAKQLLSTLESEILSGNVIIDLRNNGGGGPRTSDLFKKFFKKNKASLNLYVIQNNYCGSDCEQFLMKLKEQQKVTSYGENTRGALAYGYGNYSSPSLITPCNKFSLGLTTAKYEKYLPYEVVGISPDVYLKNNENWIEQVLKVIEK